MALTTIRWVFRALKVWPLASWIQVSVLPGFQFLAFAKKRPLGMSGHLYLTFPDNFWINVSAPWTTYRFFEGKLGSANP